MPVNQQPEALGLAKRLERYAAMVSRVDAEAAAAELLRLYEDNRRLINTLNHVSEVRSLLVEQRDELLEALAGLVGCIDHGSENLTAKLDAARAAIAKATGDTLCQ